MRKEPIDLGIDIIWWVFLLPSALTENSDKKSIRVVGLLLTFPWCLSWIITGIPVILALIILMIAQMFYDV